MSLTRAPADQRPASGEAVPRLSLTVAAQPLTQQIANHIRDLIIHDGLKPGERIREQPISEQLRVSRTPIREALQILATERLVDILPNRGALVANPGVEDLRGMLKVYSMLDGLGGELACLSAQPAQVAEVELQYDLLQVAFEAKDRSAYFQANQAFHLGIVAGSGNPTLVEIHGQLNLRLYRTRYLAVMRIKDWTSAAYQHADILKAFLDRDGPLLNRLLQAHLGFAWRQAEGVVEAPVRASA
jgi:DNA-binding GntR family transcriptional regulator